jgi:hypothetical protein
MIEIYIIKKYMVIPKLDTILFSSKYLYCLFLILELKKKEENRLKTLIEKKSYWLSQF